MSERTAPSCSPPACAECGAGVESGDGASSPVAAGGEPFAAIAGALRACAPRPDPALTSVARRRFLESAGLRAASRAAAQRRGVASRDPRSGRGRAAFWAAPVALTLAVALGACRATAQSLPDNPAYAVKLAIERGQQLAPASHGDRALRALGSARQRIEELDHSLSARKSPSVVSSVLERFQADLDVATSEAAVMSVTETTPSRADVLAAITREVVALESRQAGLSDAGISSARRIEETVDRRVASIATVGRGRVAPERAPTPIAVSLATAIPNPFARISLETQPRPSASATMPAEATPTPAATAPPAPPAPPRAAAAQPSPTAPEATPTAGSRRPAPTAEQSRRPSTTPSGGGRHDPAPSATSTARAPTVEAHDPTPVARASAPKARRTPTESPSERRTPSPR